MLDSGALKKLAELARISVSDDELATLSSELGSIVDFVAVVQSREVATDAVGGRTNVFRSDELAPLAPAYDLIEAAPEHHDHYVKVPKVID